MEVSGTITVSADASDDVGVSGVQFKLNGVNLGTEVTTAPYSVPWDTATSADGTYTLSAVARDAAGNTATSAAVSVTVSNSSSDPSVGTATPVIWTSLVNVSASANLLRKTGGCDGCDDAEAVSQQQITASDGYLEFTTSDPTSLRYVGFSERARGTGSVGITFGIRIQTGIAEVRERGAYRADTPVAAGDIFRVAVESGVVAYYKNGRRFYTSAMTPSFPLRADAALLDLNATIANAVMNGTFAATITALSPNSATAGGMGFTLTVSGSNFDSSSVVQWNGASRSTVYVNSGQLTAAIAASDIAAQETATVTVSNPGTSNPVAFTTVGQSPSASASLASAVLPESRSAKVGTPVTALATVAVSGAGAATACAVTPVTTVPAGFQYQATNPNNEVTGAPNTPVNIAAGQSQTFVIAFTPTRSFFLTDIQLNFACSNTRPAPIVSGLNTLMLSASDTPVPDLVVLAATLSNDGIVNIRGANGTGVFSVATVNLGVGGTITVTADTGSASLPVMLWLCQTDPSTGACLAPPSPAVATTIKTGEAPTFGVFVAGSGNVPFSPASSRIIVRFKDGSNIIRGSTSVAVRTL